MVLQLNKESHKIAIVNIIGNTLKIPQRRLTVWFIGQIEKWYGTCMSKPLFLFELKENKNKKVTLYLKENSDYPTERASNFQARSDSIPFNKTWDNCKPRTDITV